MAFNYAPSSAPQSGQQLGFGTGLNYGSLPRADVNYAPQGLDYGSGAQQQQGQQQGLDPSQMMQMYQQFAGSGSSAAGSQGGLSGLLGTSGSGSAGLGGSGLIGSAGGAASASSTGGAGFGLGGSLVGGSGTVGGSTFASGAAGGAGAGGAASGGAAGGMGGAMAAAGPWAALAAIIMANEEDSRKKGLRAENRGERTRDQLTGKVVTQDIEGKWGPMFDKWTGGKGTKWGLNADAKGASQVMSGRIGPGLKTMWKEGTLSKIKDIF